LKRRRIKKRVFYTMSIVWTVCICLILSFVVSMIFHPPLYVDVETLDSEYVYLMDVKSGWTTAEKKSREIMYPASMTKIMTAMIAIEHYSDLEEILTVPSDIFQELYQENAAMAGFQAGEEVCVQDLLYGVLLPSGAECCLTLAYAISGSEEAFVELMNQKAKRLGMKDTHFMNCTGLHHDEHYSTARDMADLLKYALNYDAFYEIFASRVYTTNATNIHPYGITCYSTMFNYLGNERVTGGEILGGKTGNTRMAGLCLASLAKVNGREYILITGKAQDYGDSHVRDAVRVYNQIGEGNRVSVKERLSGMMEKVNELIDKVKGTA